MSRVRMVVVVLIAVVMGTAGIVRALKCEGRLAFMGPSPWHVQALCGTPPQLNDTVAIVLKPGNDSQERVAGHLPIGAPK